MKFRTTLLIIVLVGGLSACASRSRAERWWRGQVHVHTNLTSPTEAANWYKYHDYHFVMITDLNYATPVDGVKAVVDAPGRFLVIPGIELNVEAPTPGERINDTLGYGGSPQKITQFRDPQTFAIKLPQEPAVATINLQARLIRDVGGVPSIAHPNLNWSVTIDDILATDAATIKHFEMITAEPGMNDQGGGGRPSTEEIWDAVLSTGRLMYGLAADDAHHFDDFGPRRFFADAKPHIRHPALPGRTSIYVRAERLAIHDIVSAIDNGEFYFVSHPLTRPIELKRFDVGQSGIRLELPDDSKDLGWSRPHKNPTLYRTYFIGKDGQALKQDVSRTPSYTFQGDELYVRVRVQGSDGAVLWTQPVFVKQR